MKLLVTPDNPLSDEIIDLHLEELPPEADLRCRFTTVDDNGHVWESSYPIHSDAKGRVPFSQLLAHPMDFITDMRSQSQTKWVKKGAHPTDYTLEVTRNNTLIDKAHFTIYCERDVERIDVRENGFYIVGYLPKKRTVSGGVLAFSGSGGALMESRSALFASRGIPCLSIAYFLQEGLPPTLEEIPLEYFEKAIEYVQKRYDFKQIVATGISRGGELVLLLASLFPTLFSGIIPLVPSSATYGGFPNLSKPTWTYKNTSFPIAPLPSEAEIVEKLTPGKPIQMTRFFLEGLKNETAYETAAIPVEKILCPTLLISAEDDQMWPSTYFCEKILERRKAHGITDNCEHFAYPGAGHEIIPPYFPTTNMLSKHSLIDVVFDMGGEPKAHAVAVEDAWAKMHAFILRIVTHPFTK